MQKTILLFIIIQILGGKVFKRKLAGERIPLELQSFFKHPDGICVYYIYDDFDRIYKVLKKKHFENSGDYLDVKKIVASLKGEKVFNERWPEFTEMAEDIKKDSKCLKKMILTYESFFSELKQNRIDTMSLFPPVSKKFMDEKLEALKNLSDDDTMIIINQIVMSSNLNKTSLNQYHKNFLSFCEGIDEEETFCEVLKHNQDVVESVDLVVPYISSDIFIVHN